MSIKMRGHKSRKVIIGLFAVVFAMLLSLLFAGEAKAYDYMDPDTGNRIIIEDGANVLTEAEIRMLAEDMKPALEYGNIMFVTADEPHSSGINYYAASIYHSYFGNYVSGTMVIIDFYNRDFYIFSDGKNYDILTTAKANVITDNNYKSLSNAKYYEGARNTFAQIISVLSGGRIAEPMKHICNAILAILLGMLICAIIIGATMGVKKAPPIDLVRMAAVNLFNVKAATKKTTTTKTRISSGGGGFFVGGGGGGGHSSGGGFSGGGGGFSGGGGGFSGGGGGHKF
ncbi:MAG: TPM domain-containing protein [Lachnospiraceae bacterium]|nr:TPM domain-containing protein [Lachnospiraceae bacterium]